MADKAGLKIQNFKARFDRLTSAMLSAGIASPVKVGFFDGRGRFFLGVASDF
jgi:hypothetical protein